MQMEKESKKHKIKLQEWKTKKESCYDEANRRGDRKGNISVKEDLQRRWKRKMSARKAGILTQGRRREKIEERKIEERRNKR